MIISHQGFSGIMISFLKHVVGFFLPTDTGSHVRVRKAINLATQSVRNLLSEDGSSLTDICLLIESAKSKNDLKVAFGRLNKIVWVMSMIAPMTEQNGIIYEALKELKFSEKFGLYLNSATSPHQSILAYKTAVVQELAQHYRKLEDFTRHNNSFEDTLFSTYFSSTVSQTSEVEGTLQGQLTGLCHSMISPSKKRTFSTYTECGNGQFTVMEPDSKSSKSKMSIEKMSSESKRRRCDCSTSKIKIKKCQSEGNATLCAHFKNGKCTRGSKCKYLHSN